MFKQDWHKIFKQVAYLQTFYVIMLCKMAGWPFL